MTKQDRIEVGALSPALVKALSEIEGVAKDKVNPHFKSKYADLASVLETIRPVLARHDMAVTQETSPSEDGVIVETVVLHASGEERRFGKLYLPANKRDAQGFGSAITYAKRYSLLTAFAIPTEDDDGNAAVKAGADTSGQINDAQWATLTALVDASHADVQRLCNFYQVPSLDKLPAAKFDDACEKLKAKIKQPEMAK